MPTTTKKNDREKSKELLEVLAREWPSPDCAFIEEFRSSTGYAREQRADAIAMHLWPSRGLELVGFEIKVSRGDWKHELKQVNKSHHMQQFCDRWYLVIYDCKVVKYPDELPEGWGLMCLENGKIKTMIEAKKLTSIPLDKLCVAALMRRATKK